jgi:hypothetical protein
MSYRKDGPRLTPSSLIQSFSLLQNMHVATFTTTEFEPFQHTQQPVGPSRGYALVFICSGVWQAARERGGMWSLWLEVHKNEGHVELVAGGARARPRSFMKKGSHNSRIKRRTWKRNGKGSTRCRRRSLPPTRALQRYSRGGPA